MYMSLEERKAYNTESFLEGYVNGVRPVLDYNTIDKELLIKLISEKSLVNIFYDYPEIFVEVADRKLRELAPEDIYGLIFKRCADYSVGKKSITSMTFFKCLNYLNAFISRALLSSEYITGMEDRELNEFFAYMYSRSHLIPSPTTFPIIQSVLGDRLDIRAILRNIGSYSPIVYGRVEPVLRNML